MEIASTAGKRQSKRFFFEKRTKKLLPIQAEPLRQGRSQLSQSFLLLSFKKEGLPLERYLASSLSAASSRSAACVQLLSGHAPA
jgi:hypothetical protein